MQKASRTSHPLVILHGWTLDPAVMDRWQPFVSLLKKAGFTIHFWPLPGLATSSNRSFTLADYVKWLEQKTAKLDSFLLLGHSFGGQLATRFTAQNPKKVSRLILMDSSGILDDSLPKTLKRTFFKSLAKFGRAFTQSEALRKFLYRLTRETNYYEANLAQRRTMQHILADEVENDLAKIKTPTLIIWGKNDTMTPLKLGQIFAKGIQNSQLTVIAGARHAPMYTHAEEVAEAIQKFVS